MSADVWVLSYEHLKGLPKPDYALTLPQRIASRVKPIMRKHVLSSPSSFPTIQLSWVRVPAPLMSYGIVRQDHVSMADVTSQE